MPVLGLRAEQSAVACRPRSASWTWTAALFDILPQSLQEQWNKYLPAGEIDADVRLAYDGQTWRPEVAVRCLNVSFTHSQVPLPAGARQGNAGTEGRSAEAEPDGLQRQPAGAFDGRGGASPCPAPTGWFEAKGDDIQLDESLLAALPEKPQEVVRSLDPRGTVNFYVRMWRDKPDEPMHQHLLLGVEPLLDPLRQVPLSACRTSAARWRCSTATGPSDNLEGEQRYGPRDLRRAV